MSTISDASLTLPKPERSVMRNQHAVNLIPVLVDVKHLGSIQRPSAKKSSAELRGSAAGSRPQVSLRIFGGRQNRCHRGPIKRAPIERVDARGPTHNIPFRGWTIALTI
jgi:hypothetical protein